MIERKYCKCCGQLISDINIEGTDFYRHIRIKYCPECRDMMQHYQSALRQHNYRQRNKQAQKLRDERISLLAEENAVLREYIVKLRECIK